MAENQLAGTWQVVSFELREAEGRAIYPYGQDAIGYLMYTADGYSSSHLDLDVGQARRLSQKP